jgi:transcriptional regulator GlxA family with amidase domain
MHAVAILALEGTAAFDLGVPGQILRAAVDPSTRERLYDVRMCTADGGPIQTSGGFRALPDSGPEILTTADTVIIPGIHGDFRLGEPTLHPHEEAALASVPASARMVSICTGAFALAATGRLDGRPATTHWAYAERFQRMFPLVRLNPDVLFVDDGDVLTSAGVAAGVDLCLHLIRRDFGSAVANGAARRCVVPPWREGGQAQFVAPASFVEPGSTSTGPTQAWALDRLHESLDLPALAGHARMSVRTFTRRFREETGLSPALWLARQRVDHARQLLETTDLPVDEVARRAGFGSSVSLRQHLHAAVGVAPLAYRRTFRPAALATLPATSPAPRGPRPLPATLALSPRP